ncbi:MAG: tetratricopeptide repeat protein [Bacillus sp. (in: firmicutes)]
MKENKNIGKVIPFPGLNTRLVEKGMAALVEKRYQEAVSLLQQAVKMGDEEYNTHFGLIVALVEINDYREAKAICKNLLNKGVGDYFQLMEMYVMILLQLNEYEEMESTIRALLDDGVVPPDKEEHFENMLQFTRKMEVERADDRYTEEEEELAEGGNFNLLSMPYQEQLQAVTKIREGNVRKYIEQVMDYLQSPDGYPFLKTILLLILKEQDYRENCDVEKFLKHKTVIPARLEEIEERPFWVETAGLLSDHLEHENPSLHNIAGQLLKRQHFILFPFEPVNHFAKWAAAYHLLAAEYQGVEESAAFICERYSVEMEGVEEALKLIRHIEETSSL